MSAGLVEVLCRDKPVSVGHRTQSVDGLAQHRSVDGRGRTPVLGGGHRVRELIGERVRGVEVRTVERQRALGLGDGAASAEKLGPQRRLVGPRPVGGPLDARTELLATHHREPTVDTVVFLAPLGQLPVPLVPPSLHSILIID